MRKLLLLGAALLAGTVALAANANATVILTFGQSGSGNTITGTATGGTSTTLTANNVAVSVTQIAAALTPNIAAYLDLTATSIGAASTIGGFDTQAFSGTFSITSLVNGGGVNYLSGTFVDAVFGTNGGSGLTLQASDPTEAVTFTSSVITQLGVPSSVNLSFSNVSPPLAITGTTIASFTSAVSGTFNASAATVPEPISLALFGTGLVGLGLIRRRRQG